MTEYKMQLEDWLDDLCVRFVINLPKEDLSSVERICFQVEEAQWFYEDFIRPLDPSLPSMSLRTFCLRIFQHCPLLAAFTVDNHMRAFEEFLMYKNRVPVRGAIMLNHEMDSVVLVKGWKKTANWSFPRGKISKDEDDLDCAIREVYEETGFDIRAAGLAPEPDKAKYIDIPMKEQHLRLYVFRDVSMETHFEPRTRKEISRIEWYKLSDLPAFRKKNVAHSDQVEVAKNANKFFMVAPFLVPLKRWVQQQKLADAKKIARNEGVPAYVEDVPTDVHTDQEDGFRSTTEASTSRHPSDASSQVLNTMEGATAALKQLLRIQPATQGLQQQAPDDQAAATGNTGKDLLALLRGNPQLQRPAALQHGPQPQHAQAPTQQMPSANGPSDPPQTPLEALFTSAQMPPNPHPIHSGRRVLSANYFGQPHGAPPRMGGPPQIAAQGQYQMPTQSLPTPSPFRQPNNGPAMELGAQAPPASQLPPPQPQPNVLPSQEVRNPQLPMPVRSAAPQQPSVHHRPGQSRDIRSSQLQPRMPTPKNMPIRPVAILARPPPGRREQTPEVPSNAAAERQSASPPRPDVYDMQRRVGPPAPEQLPPVPAQKADLLAMFKSSSRNLPTPGSVPSEPEQTPVVQQTAAPSQPHSFDRLSLLRGSDKGLVAAQATPQQKPITPQQKSALLSIFNVPGRQVASPQAASAPLCPSQQRTDLTSMFQQQRKPSLGLEPKQDLLRMLNVQSPKASSPVPQQPKMDIRSQFQAPERKLSFGVPDKNKNDLLAMLQNRTPKAATPDQPRPDPFSKFQAPERKPSFGLDKGDLLSMLKGKSPQPPAPVPAPPTAQAPGAVPQMANLLSLIRGNSSAEKKDIQSMFKSPELRSSELKSPEQQKSNLLALLKGNGVPPAPPQQQQPQPSQYGISMMQNGLSQHSFGQQNAHGAENRAGPLPPLQHGGMVGQQQQSQQTAPRGLPEHKSHLLDLFNGYGQGGR